MSKKKVDVFAGDNAVTGTLIAYGKPDFSTFDYPEFDTTMAIDDYAKAVASLAVGSVFGFDFDARKEGAAFDCYVHSEFGWPFMSGGKPIPHDALSVDFWLGDFMDWKICRMVNIRDLFLCMLTDDVSSKNTDDEQLIDEQFRAKVVATQAALRTLADELDRFAQLETRQTSADNEVAP